MKQLLKWAVPIALIGAAAWADVTVSDARATVDAFKERDPDMGPLFTNNVGYIVFPEINKGAFIFGGAGGEGILFEHGIPTGRIRMTQVTVGAQVGGKKYSELVFVQDNAALYRLKHGEASLSAQAGAVAAGKERKVEPAYDNGLEVFTLPIGGLMAEASVGGQKFDFQPWAVKPQS